MTRIEAFDEIKEVIETYITIEFPGHTTSEYRQVFDLLDDIERLLKG